MVGEIGHDPRWLRRSVTTVSKPPLAGRWWLRDRRQGAFLNPQPSRRLRRSVTIRPPVVEEVGHDRPPVGEEVGHDPSAGG
jgi:hypothetical protein